MEQLTINMSPRIDQEAALEKVYLDRAPFCFYRCDRRGHFLYGNQKTCESLGYTTDELRNITIFDIDPTMDPDRWLSLWQRLLVRRQLAFETIHRCKVGSDFPVEMTMQLIQTGKSPSAGIFVRKVDEHKQTQKEVIEKRLVQAQRMESLGTLASGVAHDFNNILSAISGYAELAQLRCSAQSKMRQYIDQICTASIRAKNLIKQILTFSKQGESKKQQIDISIVIQETLRLIQATLPSTIEIKQNIPSGLGDVFADDSQIHQIVMNLCTNAYHAMQEHGGLLEVDLDRVTIGTYDSQCYPVISPGNYFKLRVSDTGTGIPDDMLSRIFEPYFSTKPSGEGTGMGLSAVHGIVEDHGGGIKVSSIQGVGTTFQVFLPLSKAATDQPNDMNSTVSILIVDDERLLLKIAREYLEELGYRVVTMENPVDAIDTIRLNPEKFNLIITDLTMPTMTGETLAREIKKIRFEIPIILCTGFGTYTNGDRLKEVGISHLLTKPINLTELGSVIRRLLNSPRI